MWRERVKIHSKPSQGLKRDLHGYRKNFGNGQNHSKPSQGLKLGRAGRAIALGTIHPAAICKGESQCQHRLSSRNTIALF